MKEKVRKLLTEFSKACDAMDAEKVAEIENKLVNLISESAGSASCEAHRPSIENFKKVYFDELDKLAFRVPYNGSNKYYDEKEIEFGKKLWEQIEGALTSTSARAAL